jgi:hypothetical protein
MLVYGAAWRAGSKGGWSARNFVREREVKGEGDDSGARGRLG